jgi:sulfopyruvate decarboxylase subunit beta
MNLGTLASIAHHAPENYQLVILDNCCYGSTGSQPTCTNFGTDLAAMAKAAGIEKVVLVDRAEQLAQALTENCIAIVAKVEEGNAAVPIISLSPKEIIERFSRCARSSHSSGKSHF